MKNFRLMLIGLLTFQAAPVYAQAQALPAAVAACSANPAVCAVIGATAAGWIILQNGDRYLCTWGGCKPFQERSRIPQETRSQGDEQIQHYGVTTPDRCQNIVNRLKRSGYRARLIRARKNNLGSGGVLQWVCEIQTDAPTDFYPSFGGQRE